MYDGSSSLNFCTIFVANRNCIPCTFSPISIGSREVSKEEKKGDYSWICTYIRVRSKFEVEIGYYLLSPLTTYINFHPLISKVTSKLFQSNPYLVTITPRVRPKFMKMSFQSLHKVLLQTPPKYISNLSRYSKGITNSWKSHHKVIPGQPRP